MGAAPLPGDYFVVDTVGGPWYDRAARRIIEADTDAKVDHAGLYVGPTAEHPEGAIVEAVWRVRYNSINAYPNAVWSTGRLPGHLTPDDRQRRIIAAFAEEIIGSGYNWLDLAAIGIAQRRWDEDRIAKWAQHPPWYVRRLSADHRYICSQVVDAAYETAGIHLLADRRPVGLCSPGDLDALLQPA